MDKNTIQAPLQTKGSLTGKLTIGSIKADLTNYYNKEEIDELLKTKSTINHEHTEYVLKEELPSIDGLASETYVDGEISKLRSKHDSELGLINQRLTDMTIDFEDNYIDENMLEAELTALETKLQVQIDKQAGKITNLENNKASLTDLENSFYALDALKANKQHSHTEYALKEELPSIDNFASKNDLDAKADITYVDNAINTALNGIESQLDQIIGEEV